MKRSKSKNLCFKWHSRENFCTYKNEKQMYNVIKYAKKSNSKKGRIFFGMQSNTFPLIYDE